ncbi:MAG TPA: hypothetical protein VFA22_07705, partial [Stellaceae bacterium]|nr:hypothetical protein [Stellaceae bacterium]
MKTRTEAATGAAPPREASWEGWKLLQELYRTRLRGTVSILVGLALWEVFSRYVIANPLFLASPLQIVAAIIKLAGTGELEYHMEISGIEFILGYVIASVIGIALGVAMAMRTAVKQMAQPWVSGFYATPTIALAPLFIL